MTTTHPSSGGLAVIVERLTAYLEAKTKLTKPSPASALPEGLERVFECFSHHLVALALVARADGRIVDAERELVFRHCVELARQAGLEMTAAEEEALREYLAGFRPTMELMTTLARLKRDSKAQIASLIAAAHALVRADGVVRLQEASYLDSLQRDLT